jgi:hypothetical protein
LTEPDHDKLDERTLRDAFTSVCGTVSGSCPPRELVWEVVAGSRPAPERRAVVDHVATCAACRCAWLLAHELAVPAPPASASRRQWLLGIAAAVVTVGVVGWLALARYGGGRHAAPGESTLRAAPNLSIEAVPGDGAILSRAERTLRWTVLEEGTLYDVDVTTAALEPLAEARSLESASFVLPEASLASLPSGTEVWWRVRARRPGGVHTASRTFAWTLE